MPSRYSSKNWRMIHVAWQQRRPYYNLHVSCLCIRYIYSSAFATQLMVPLDQHYLQYFWNYYHLHLCHAADTAHIFRDSSAFGRRRRDRVKEFHTPLLSRSSSQDVLLVNLADGRRRGEISCCSHHPLISHTSTYLFLSCCLCVSVCLQHICSFCLSSFIIAGLSCIVIFKVDPEKNRCQLSCPSSRI